MINSQENLKELPEIKEIQKRVEKLEFNEREKEEEKEKVIKKEIKSFIQEAQTPSISTTPQKIKQISQQEPDKQIEDLISIVFQEKDLSRAIAIAQQLNNPFILDKFHDTLVNNYYKLLIENKIINQF